MSLVAKDRIAFDEQFMTLKTISLEQLALETGKVASQAERHPILVRRSNGQTLVLRALCDDDVADELIVKHPEFRARIRQARRNHAAGKGIPLHKLMNQYGARRR